MLHSGGEHGARHPGGVGFEEGEELLAADGAEDCAGGFVDEVFGVIDQLFGEGECVGGVAVADEVECGVEGGAAFPDVGGLRELMEDGARLAWGVREVAADDVDRAEVDEVPAVDAVVAAEIKVVQLAAAVRGGLLPRRLLVHDADRAGAGLVDVALEEAFDLVEREVDELLREVEDVALADANEVVACAVLAVAGLEVALDLADFVVGLKRLEALDEVGGGE